MDSSPVIELRGVTKRFRATVAVDRLDLSVFPGEVFGFLGPNGSGKTTTIRLLLGLLRPTAGEARLYGEPSGRPAVRDRVGYLPGELVLDGRMTGHDTLRLLASLGTRPASRRVELCRRLALSETDLERRVRDYSRGMKQKLGLIAAFQHDPDLLLLDEPTTALDPLVRETVFDLLAEAGRRGRTVFHSSHVLSEVDRTCTRVAIVGRGRLLGVMRVDDVHRSSVRRMVIDFAAEPPVGELDLPGIEIVERDGARVVLRVAGALDPLLAVLARHSIKHLVFPEPGLEEAFVDLYRGSGDEARRPEAGGAS